MATYHCTARIGGKGHAAAHAEYLAREGKYSGCTRYEDLEAARHGNLPPWAEHNPAHFWQAADQFERKNGSTYREIEIALPRELNPEQRRALVDAFIQQEIGDRHAYTYAIHNPKAALEKGEQPHAHIMYSERLRDGIDRDPAHYFKRYNAKQPERGGCQKYSGGKTQEEMVNELKALRERWADLQNAHLALHGHESTVDHRSLKEQGIEREPEKHLGGPGVRKLNSDGVTAILERRAAEGEQERSQQEVSIIDLSGDLEKAKAERDELRETVTAGVAGIRAEYQQWKQAELAKQQAIEAALNYKIEQARQRQAEAQRLAEAQKQAEEQRQAEARRAQEEAERVRSRGRSRSRGRDDDFELER